MRAIYPFIFLDSWDKQSQIAERKTVGEQGPGDHGKEAAEQKSGRWTPEKKLAGRG